MRVRGREGYKGGKREGERRIFLLTNLLIHSFTEII